MQNDFPEEIYMRYECHVVKYFLNDREIPTQGRYYDLAQVPESQHVHFENKIYFQDKVPVTITVFKDKIKALEAAHYYAKSKMHNIEKELDKLYKK